jgi:long-chain acyl-CoA synthetase
LKTTILLTGATGFLGTQIARQILQNQDVELIALLRAPNEDEAQTRLRREWWDWPELRIAIGGRIKVQAGELTLPDLGLPEAQYGGLIQRVTHIIHAAADIRLFAALEDLRQVNVTGTRHVLELARDIQADHGLRRLAHVSTAYVAGKHAGPVAEEDLSDRDGFSSPYERSKYEAEVLVRQAGADLPISIFRPGMIVGDSHSGIIKTFNTLYYPLRLYMTRRMWIAPARPDLRVNLVPVDYVAQCIARLVFDPLAAGLTFHLTPPDEALPTLADIAHFTRWWAQSEMGVRLPVPRFLPLPGLEKIVPRVLKFLRGDLAELARLLPYFQSRTVFLRANTDRLLDQYPVQWRELLPHLLDYAVRQSFWGRAPRTVHEQILVRLQSRSRPVAYRDLAGGQQFQRSATEMRGEILAAAAALRALGVAAGDRVAIVGQNSTRYFSTLMACGVSGAVSATFYATSTVEEIADLLQDCGARVLLIGTESLLNAVDDLAYDGAVISMCRGGIPAKIKRRVIAWQEFLAMGSAHASDELAPVGLDAPAVLAYSSGTTGQPKRVLFRHEQLRWIASTLASMFPWRERHRWGAYLSYLPMNHVVEGILATYSPYYVPAALDIAFLQEFNDLPQALLETRPTIFFSVPRFFEKVQAAALENPLARAYRMLPEGPARRALRTLLRRGLLRKAGLDRCRQIIVGSAPSDAGLLGFFVELGVEVYDAYGLTEAPLVSLNRLGRNRVGTVGEALPETEIRIQTDGEVQVRGPQVAAETNRDQKMTALAEGWLDTGDLGELSPDGYLTLNGRKKDLIVTAYGLKISPTPIEARLRCIPGVAEVMLVGDRRPYFTALFWPEDHGKSPGFIQAVEEGIRALNGRLARSEQIKRWAILAENPSIQNGSLTGSLKLKRDVVTARLAKTLDALYRGETPPGVLYCTPAAKS